MAERHPECPTCGRLLTGTRPTEPVDLPAGARHGTENAYGKHGCGCVPCRKAHARSVRESKARMHHNEAVARG